MRQGFVFRPGTHDEAMFHHILAHNEYRLPEAFRPDDIILDVGMHIGAFSYKALTLGSCRVHGYEADPANYACAVENLRPFGDRVRLHNRGVWRSDRRVERLFLTRAHDSANTGGNNVVWANEGEGESVPVIAFDDIVREVTEGGRRRVRLLKIDCEGSEFPILLTSKLLHLIDEIAGEFHEFCGEFDRNVIPDRARIAGYERFTIAELTRALEAAGFAVTSERCPGSNLGMFFAVAKPGAIPRPKLLGGRVGSAWRRLIRRGTPM